MSNSLVAVLFVAVLVMGLTMGWLAGSTSLALKTITSTQTTTPPVAAGTAAVVNLAVIPDWGRAGYDAFVIPSYANGTTPRRATNTTGPGPNDNNITVPECPSPTELGDLTQKNHRGENGDQYLGVIGWLGGGPSSECFEFTIGIVAGMMPGTNTGYVTLVFRGDGWYTVDVFADGKLVNGNTGWMSTVLVHRDLRVTNIPFPADIVIKVTSNFGLGGEVWMWYESQGNTPELIQPILQTAGRMKYLKTG